jgi:Fe-S cluster assembly scaffold protein SufB
MNDVKNFSNPLLKEIADITDAKDLTGAYSLRKDGLGVELFSTENIKITPKPDKPGIDINVVPFSKDVVHMPVILTKPGVDDTVYNEFFIGEGAEVTIIAGCGIHNDGHANSRHVGIHTFHLGKGSRVKYVEKHYGQGEGTGEKVLNPATIINMDENSYAEFDMVQIKGVDSTIRNTTATLEAGAFLQITERVLTHDKQTADSYITVGLKGDDSSVQVVSRSVAQNTSKQAFFAKVEGHASCKGHVQCDAIIMDEAKIRAVPEISAFSQDAQLVHEAAIGKIAGDQILKLMTLGLTAEEAEERILQGFLK